MSFTTRPTLMATHGMITSSHYLASESGNYILRKGGNAADAGAAMWFVLTVTKPDLAGMAGEMPIIAYLSDEERVISVNGQVYAPKAANVDWFLNEGYDAIPEDGFLASTVPSAFDAWITLLEKYGTMGLSELMEPAIKIASEGYPMQETMVTSIKQQANRFLNEWSSTPEIYLPLEKVPDVGQVIKNTDLARTFKRFSEEEQRARRNGRVRGLRAAHEYFYNGPIAKTIVEYIHSHKCRDCSRARRSNYNQVQRV